MGNKNKKTYRCIKCHSEKYCSKCNKGYTIDENFCSKCGKKLDSLKKFVNKDCPICTKNKIPYCYVVETEQVEIDPEELKIAIEKSKSFVPTGGVIIEEECECENYEPTSTSGVIDDSCRNCGGKPKEILLD